MPSTPTQVFGLGTGLTQLTRFGCNTCSSSEPCSPCKPIETWLIPSCQGSFKRFSPLEPQRRCQVSGQHVWHRQKRTPFLLYPSCTKYVGNRWCYIVGGACAVLSERRIPSLSEALLGLPSGHCCWSTACHCLGSCGKDAPGAFVEATISCSRLASSLVGLRGLVCKWRLSAARSPYQPRTVIDLSHGFEGRLCMHTQTMIHR